MTATEAPGRADAAIGQQWNPDAYRRWASYVPELGRGVVDLLDPRPQERVLDLGVVCVTLLLYSKYDYFD